MKNLTVRLVKKSDLSKLSEIYSRVFSEADPKKPWDIEHSYLHLQYWFKIQPDMFFGAFNQKNELMGGIAVSVKPWRRGNRCSAGIIFVDNTCQVNGVGKALFRKMLEKAVEKYQARSFEAITFAGKEFPQNWYKRLGIVPDEDALLVKGPCLGILEKL
jgi:GNAT superfamily N-acetyltransferase